MTFESAVPDQPAAAALTVMTEAEFAAMRAEEGARVVEGDGRYRAETFRGSSSRSISWRSFRQPTSPERPGAAGGIAPPSRPAISISRMGRAWST